jgi:hypothetical protein
MTLSGLADADPHHHSHETFASHAPGCAARGPTRRISAGFGPVTLAIETWGEMLTSVALDPLRHAMTDMDVRPDLSLLMLDGKETGIEAMVLERLWQQQGGDYGPIVPPRRLTLTINEDMNVRTLVDAHRQRIAVWFGDVAAAPEWLIYDQIRNALHLASRERSFGMFHAAALRYRGVGCLITGKSGSGKSTMTAAAVTRGFETAGDDFVLIETDGTPRAHAIFDTIKLDERGLTEFPQFRPFICNATRPAEDKAITHLYDAAPDRIASGFPLRAILHARLTGERQSRIVASTRAAAYLALTPSTMFLLRAENREVGAKCAALVDSLDAYAFEIGTDSTAAVAELSAFIRAQV